MPLDVKGRSLFPAPADGTDPDRGGTWRAVLKVGQEASDQPGAGRSGCAAARLYADLLPDAGRFGLSHQGVQPALQIV